MNYNFYNLKLKDTLASKEGENADRTVVERAFNCKFEASYRFENFENYMNNCVSEWIDGNIYAPIGFLVQSSGMGKTRYMKEFAEKNWCLSICLRNSDKIGFPKRSKNADAFETAMDDLKHATIFMISMMRVLFEYIGRIVDKYGKCKKCGQNLSVQDLVCKELAKFHPWSLKKDDSLFDSIVNNYNSCLENEKASLDSDDFLRQQDIKMKEIFNDFRNKYPMTEIRPIYFLIDEASALLQNESSAPKSNLGKISPMRRALKCVFENLKVAFLLADSQNCNRFESRVAFRLSDDDYDDSSYPKTTTRSRPIYDEFFRVIHFDISSYSTQFQTYKGEIEQFARKRSFNNQTFLTQRDPYTSLYFYGRPLWGSLLSENYGFDAILKLAKEKLVNSNEPISKIDKQYWKQFACKAVIASLTNRTVTDPHYCNSILVDKYMSTFHRIKETTEIGNKKKLIRVNHMFIAYPSEPILAEAAAEIISEPKEFDAMISCINKYHDTFSTRDDIGELIYIIDYMVHRWSNQKIISITYSLILKRIFLLKFSLY